MENKLIEQLAAKLGTTAEYLWSILIKQAPVYATITLVQILLVIVFGVVLLKLHKYFSIDDNKWSYYNQEEGLVVPMIFAAIGWSIFLVVSFLSLPEAINGYFNPEFWAFDYIMDKIK